MLLASSSASLPSWWSLLWFALSIKVVVAPAPCPSNAAVIGYTSIQEINNVMAQQLSGIQGGSAPQPPYIFSLCPNTTFVLAGEPLRILLNETYIVCGANSALSDGCIIEGGAVQVSIADSTVPGYTLQDVKFQGITFRGATEASIDASAGSGTAATFIDCQWDVSHIDVLGQSRRRRRRLLALCKSHVCFYVEHFLRVTLETALSS